MVGDAATRKLAAILHADVVGYSRLMGEDEAGTHRALRQYLHAIAGSINKHQGRVVNYSGDAVLADFITVTDALSAASKSKMICASAIENRRSPTKERFSSASVCIWVR